MHLLAECRVTQALLNLLAAAVRAKDFALFVVGEGENLVKACRCSALGSYSRAPANRAISSPTSLVRFDPLRSGVRTFRSRRHRSIERKTAAPATRSPRKSSISAPAQIAAMGFARPVPLSGGALP